MKISVFTLRGSFVSWVPFFSMLGFVCAWEAFIRLGGYDLRVFAPPSKIAVKLYELLWPAEGKIPILIVHLFVTLCRLAVAAFLAAVAGVILGIASGMNRYAYRTIHPVVNSLNSIPAYAWIPFLLLWLGRGNITIVFVTALSACLPLVLNTMAGVRGVDHHHVWALRSFGADSLRVVRYVVIPSAFSSIILGLRLSFAQAWRTLAGAEFIAAPDLGLGYLIYNARTFLAIDVMFAGLVMLALFGYLYIYWLVGKIERNTVVRWGIISKT